MLKYFWAFVPLIGTAMGAYIGTVDGLNGKFKEKEGALVAFATGILCSICFNLFFEASGYIRNISLYVGGIVGFLFIKLMNWIAHKQRLDTKSKLFWAMLFHNIPEGIVSGITLADSVVLPAAFSLILSISLQNLPDGLVVSMPLVSTKGKSKALLYGILSGAVEPIASILIIVTAGRMTNLQMFEPFLIGFSFASIFMVSAEMLKECKGKVKIVVITAAMAWVFNIFLDFILA